MFFDQCKIEKKLLFIIIVIRVSAIKLLRNLVAVERNCGKLYGLLNWIIKGEHGRFHTDPNAMTARRLMGGRKRRWSIEKQPPQPAVKTLTELQSWRQFNSAS